jgi:hypothetical protein
MTLLARHLTILSPISGRKPGHWPVGCDSQFHDYAEPAVAVFGYPSDKVPCAIVAFVYVLWLTLRAFNPLALDFSLIQNISKANGD